MPLQYQPMYGPLSSNQDAKLKKLARAPKAINPAIFSSPRKTDPKGKQALKWSNWLRRLFRFLIDHAFTMTAPASLIVSV